MEIKTDHINDTPKMTSSATSPALPVQAFLHYQCNQTCTTNATKLALAMQHCSIACIHAFTPESAKAQTNTHMFTPIATLHACLQSQCNIACIPAIPMQACMHSSRQNNRY